MSTIKLFSNLLVYRLTGANPLLSLDANELLAGHPARTPGNQELQTIGFTKPAFEEDCYLERVNTACRVFAVGISERMLPAKIVRAAVTRKVRDIEETQQRKVYAREKQQLKDEVIQEMLPRAFIDTRVIYGMALGPYLIIDTSSVKRAESILCLLRETVGSLNVRPVAVKATPIGKFTDWFTHKERMHHFELTGDFKANSAGDEFDFVNGKGTSPEDETLSDLVAEAGRRVTVLGLKHNCEEGEPISFTVNEMLGIKGVKWPDHLLEQINADAGEQGDDADAHRVNLMRATFILLAQEIHKLLQDLLLELGGEEVPEGDEEVLAEQQRQISLLDGLFHRDLLSGLAAQAEKFHQELAQAGGRVVHTTDEEDALI